MKAVFIVLALTVLWVTHTCAQSYEPRAYYGQLLEPMDAILHGAGQDAPAFRNYWEVMNEGQKPIVYMHYEALFNISPNWATVLKGELSDFFDQMIVIQLGLELVGVTDDIATGELDEDIEHWLDGVEELGLPVYVRLGYEFNGFDWNRYEPESYKAAFIHLTEKIRERDLEVATVWNYVPNPTQPSNFMAYYPGDEYVDWWSINYFEPSQIGNALSEAYLDSAAVHGRPVLIGESTPKDIGVLDGEADWNAWFVPFFEELASEPGIKVTGYINWNWANFPQWRTWGDARLEQNQVVLDRYKTQIGDPIFNHAASERSYRLLLGQDEQVPPRPVDGISISGNSLPIDLQWNASTDESGISRYLIYNGEQLIDFTKRTSATLRRGSPGDTLRLSVVAMDRAGNEGAASEIIDVVLEAPEEPVELITNGQFDQGSEGWSLTEFVPNVSGVLDVDSTSVLDGVYSAHVTILQNTGTNWHLQLEQPLFAQAGHRYAISYTVRADRETSMEMWFQKADSPFTGYAQRTIQLSTEAQSFRDTAFVPIDDNVFMRFMLGTSGLSQVWIDNVSVLDLGVLASTNQEDPFALPGQLSLHPPYPNPVQSTVTFRYELPEPQNVEIKLFDILGRQVAVVEEGFHVEGTHQAIWDAHALAPGMYIARLLGSRAAQVRSFVVVR